MIIRQLQQSDKKRWISFFQSLSEDTIENRYHHLVKNKDIDIIKGYWNYLIHDSISIIIEVDETVIGCAELYINTKNDGAEIAITIADKWQDAGMGNLLMCYMEVLINCYYDIKSITLNILPTNTRMKKLAEKHRFKYHKDYVWIKEI